MMANRKIHPDVQAIFERYQEGHVRRLKKEDALKLLCTEFSLASGEAEQMLSTFDKDGNGSLSLWEFQQFYQIVGNAASDIVVKFKELDKDNSGRLDVDEARAGLKSLTLADGSSLGEKEIEFFIRSSLQDDNQIDLGHFASLLYRLKMHKKTK